MSQDFAPQGGGQDNAERLPMPELSTLNPEQRAAADALIAGPRKGVKGPFIALMRSPALLDRFAKVGEYLRFESALDTRINEFVTAVVARHMGNQFEWFVHHPLAIKAGVSQQAIAELAQGARPSLMAEDEALAYDLAMELMRAHGLSDVTYAQALGRWGERGVVELVSLIGYFTAINWVMNVARTPAPGVTEFGALDNFPL